MEEPKTALPYNVTPRDSQHEGMGLAGRTKEDWGMSEHWTMHSVDEWNQQCRPWWRRDDGAEARQSPPSHGYTVPWLAYPPDSDNCLVYYRSRWSHYGIARRFKTATGAMAALDREYPLKQLEARQ